MAIWGVIEAVARRAVVARGEKKEDITDVCIGFPKLTSAVTATFNVKVMVGENGSYEIPVATRVSYSHPVAVEI